MFCQLVEVLDEVNGLCTIAKRLLKGADDVVSTRSCDLREIASLLHGDPVKCALKSLDRFSPICFL